MVASRGDRRLQTPSEPGPARSATRGADSVCGYLHPLYAQSFEHLGRPVGLGQSGGWLIERAIGRTGRHDVAGVYPLFCCRDWKALPEDLARHGLTWVSLAAVTDPFGDYDRALLDRAFDTVAPYKEHYVADMAVPLESFVSKSHRTNARRALRNVEVEVCPDPSARIDEWVDLYSVLVTKHEIRGLRAFSRAAFAKQLSVPGLVMFRAAHADRTVGLDLWYVQNDVAHGHLAAFSEDGYRLRASYATKWTLLTHFAANGVRWVNFGGLPGLPGSPGSDGGGLGHFKQGWSNTLRMTYLCGRIFDGKAYDELTRGAPETSYFPAYRAGEAS